MPDAPPPTPRCRVEVRRYDDIDVISDVPLRLIGSVLGESEDDSRRLPSWDAVHFWVGGHTLVDTDVTRDEAITLLHVHLLMNEPCYDGVLEREFPHLFATPLEHADAVV